MMFYGPPAGMPPNAPQVVTVSAPVPEPPALAIIPVNAFGVSEEQLAVWEYWPKPPYHPVTVVRGRCDYEAGLSGEPYFAYLLPDSVAASSYIAGWLQGRRSIEFADLMKR